MFVTKSSKGTSIKAYRGDAKTMLAFNLTSDKSANLAGFTIACQPAGQAQYYIYNKLQFRDPSQHAQVPNEVPNSSINAPIQKFRWLHVPGSFHQGEDVFYGTYTYTVTPRYFQNGKMIKIDTSLSVSIDIEVGPYDNNNVALGFTRGFVQSQAFVNHFGNDPSFQPKGALVFDTTQEAGKDNHGNSYTYKDEYVWSGFTARQRIFDLVNTVLNDGSLTMDIFAYDFNEPDIINNLLALAEVGRVRIILDNATLHHDAGGTKNEDQFTALFTKAAHNGAAIKRGKFGRFAHDKIMIIYKSGIAQKVLTGSTNFSVTGLYINANHVLVFNDPTTAGLYANVFDESWNDNVSISFHSSQWADMLHPISLTGVGEINVTFSPHNLPFATSNLTALASRITAENSSVLFAVMALDNGGGPVLPALMNVHTDQNIFSYGISDSPGGITLYKPGAKTGVVVTGKSAKSKLPPPFDQEDSIGLAHQIHHKFIVCGFNTKNAMVACGSSNLALGGEEENGDNLLVINDQDIATVFAIEAVALVDHFDFRNANANTPGQKNAGNPVTMNLNQNDKWAKAYFDTNDLHCTDRLLFS